MIEFQLDPFAPNERAWVALALHEDAVGQAHGCVWRSDNLADTQSVTWSLVLTETQIIDAIQAQGIFTYTRAVVKRLAVSPLNEDLLYVTVSMFKDPNSNDHLYVGQSNDGGDTWTWSRLIGEGRGGNDLELSRINPYRLWVNSTFKDDQGDYNCCKLYEITNLVPVPIGPRSFKVGSEYEAFVEIHIPQAAEDWPIFVRLGHLGRIYRLSDDESSWEEITAGKDSGTVYISTAMPPQAFQSSPHNAEAMFYISTEPGGRLLWSSIDAGATWAVSTTISSPNRYVFWAQTPVIADSKTVAQNIRSWELLSALASGGNSQDNQIVWYSSNGGLFWEDKTGDLKNKIDDYAGAWYSNTILKIVDSATVVPALAPESACTAAALTSSQATAGSSINTQTGAYSYNTTDLSIPTAAGPLTLERTYSTLATSIYTTTLGYGWTHNQEMRLILPDQPGGHPGQVLFKGHSTNQYRFYQRGDNEYEAYSGLCATLTRQGDTFILTEKDQRTYTFNASNGRLMKQSDPQGHTWYYLNDHFNRLAYISDQYFLHNPPDGARYIRLIYPSYVSDRLAGAIAHAGSDEAQDLQVNYTYTGAGELSSVNDVLGYAWTYAYTSTYTNTAHLLAAVYDPLGYAVERTHFDQRGRALHQFNSAGELVVNLRYHPNGVTEVGNIVSGQIVTSTHTYDYRHTLVGQFAPGQAGTYKLYDANFRPYSITDPLSHTTSLTWSANGWNLERVVQPEGITTSFSYDQWNNLTSTIDGRGYPTTYIYSGTLLLQTTDALGKSAIYTYTNALTDPDIPPNLLKAVQDANGQVTRYEYNQWGQRTAVESQGQRTSFGYDLAGLPLWQRSHGQVHWTCYDLAGRVVRTATSFVSDGDPLPSSPCGLVYPVPAYAYAHDTRYNGAGQLIASLSWEVQNGQPVTITERTYYDAAGRPLYQVSNLRNWALDNPTPPPQGLRTVTDNILRKTVYAYGGQVIAQLEWVVEGSLAYTRTARTYYDALGRTEYVTQNFVGDLYGSQPPAYDPAYPDRNITTHTFYDAAGNVIAVQSPPANPGISAQLAGAITRTYYDAANRPHYVVQNWIGNLAEIYLDEIPANCFSRNPAATENVCSETRYDENSNVVATIDPLGSITRTFFDPLNRPILTLRNSAYTGADLPTPGIFGNDHNVADQTVYDAGGRAIASIAWRVENGQALSTTHRTYFDDLGRPYLNVANLEPGHDLYDNNTPPECNNNETGEADLYNICTETVYDTQSGQAIASLDALGRISRTYFDAQNRPFLAVQNLTQSVYSDTLQTDYGNDHNVAQETRYDDNGRAFASIAWLVENGQVISRTTRTYFNPLGQVTDVLQNFTGDLNSSAIPAYDPNYPDRNVRTQSVYASDGRIIASIEWLATSAGQVFTRTQRTYSDRLGRPALVVSNLDPTWDYRRADPPPCNRSTDGSDTAYNLCQETTYNAAGQVIERRNALDKATLYQYDRLGRLVQVTDPLERMTQYHYDAAGNRSEVVDPKGISTYFVYDPLGRLTKVWENYHLPFAFTHQDNLLTQYSYNALGARLAITDALGHSTSFEYHPLGYLLSETDAISHTWEYRYNAAGVRVWMIDPNHAASGEKTWYRYDDLDRLARITYPGSDGEVRFEYNALGQRTVMTDTLGLTTWRYDGLGQPLTITLPTGGAVGYRFDAQGSRTRLVYPDGKQVNYGYDSLSRLTRVTDWAGRVVTYTYNVAGDLTAIFRPNGVSSRYGYDSAGQLTSLAHLQKTCTLSWFDYAYDLAGNRWRTTERYNFCPNYLGLVVRPQAGQGQQAAAPLVGEMAMASAYPAPGEELLALNEVESAAAYPAPVEEEISWLEEALELFLPTPQPVELAAPQPTLTAQVAASEIEMQTPLSGSLPDTTITYTYDALSRLTLAAYDNGRSYAYGFDAVGNRTAMTTTLPGEESPVLFSHYQYDDANRLVSANGAQYDWDNNGNLLSDGTGNYQYDKANRLILANDGQALSQFRYNGAGDRLMQVTNSITTTYTLDLAAGLTQVLADGAHTYLYGLGRISQHTTSGYETFMGDALGSVRQLVDGSGNVTLTRSYAPYGEPLWNSGSGTSSYGFTGEVQENGLVFLRARYYSSQQGRFISRDTWEGDYEQPMSYNAWLYAYANSVNLTDPSGLCVPGADGDACRKLASEIESNHRVHIDLGVFVSSTLYGLVDSHCYQIPSGQAVYWTLQELQRVDATINLVKSFFAASYYFGGPAFANTVGRGELTIRKVLFNRQGNEHSLTQGAANTLKPMSIIMELPEAAIGEYRVSSDAVASGSIIHELFHVFDLTLDGYSTDASQRSPWTDGLCVTKGYNSTFAAH